MKLITTDLAGVYIIDNFKATDNRGSFIKTYHEELFIEKKLSHDFKESYYSISNKDVIRGMHFQIPPSEHEKLVYVPKGKIIDVILDLRSNLNSFGKSISVELSENNNRSIYIPKGLAHGFRSLEDNTITIYNVSTTYYKEYDSGISWNSFGFDWGVCNPILSKRDSDFENFDEFKKINPFK